MNGFRKFFSLLFGRGLHGAASPSKTTTPGRRRVAPAIATIPFSIEGYIDTNRIGQIDRAVMHAVIPGGILEIKPEHAEMQIGREEAEAVATRLESVLLDFNQHEIAYYVLMTKFNYVRQGGNFLKLLRDHVGEERFEEMDRPENNEEDDINMEDLI